MTEVIFIGLAVFIAVTMIFSIVLPLVSRREVSDDFRNANSNLAVFRDQLDEINRDREVGRIHEAEADAAKAEVERRILREIDEKANKGRFQPSSSQKDSNRFAFPILLALVAVVASFGLYLNIGRIGFDDTPLSVRQKIQSVSPPNNVASGDSIEEGRAALARLEKRLETHPTDLKGWVMLARIQRALGDYKSSAQSFEKAIKVADQGKSADLLSDYGEALVFESFGTVPPRAIEVFKEALELDETDIKSRFYIAASRLQSGDYHGAIALWRGLVVDAPPGAPWLDAVREQISNTAVKNGIMPNNVAPERRVLGSDGLSGPIAGDIRPDQDSIDIVKNMDPANQQAFIRSMVQRLADKLDRNPEDVDGWIRLGRAYRVLGDNRKAKQSFTEGKRQLEKLLGGTAQNSQSRKTIETKLEALEILNNE
jgi:cytochrome c-type biogenesis protein CcmH